MILNGDDSLKYLFLTLMATRFPQGAYGQTLAEDCATADFIWKALGQTKTIPSSCCSTSFGITCSSGRITKLNWFYKGIKGPLPTEIGKLTGLEQLILSGNSLNGPIPSSLGNLRNLSEV
jgi:hypothetical protein